MRSMLAATLMMATGLAMSQAAAQPKPAGAPARPAPQTPAETVEAMALAERKAIQSDLAWTGDYNGVIDGVVGSRTIAAIKSFQQERGATQTGVLNPKERELLADAAKKLQKNVGWKMLTDPVTGARLGLPARLVPKYAGDDHSATWRSATGTIAITLTRRQQANPSTARLAAVERTNPPGRKVGYSLVKPDFFVLSGTEGLKTFYIRGQTQGSEFRILTVLYDQATEGVMAPVVVAMSNAFDAFPTGAQAGPAPRKRVEYATGIVADSAGAVVTAREAVDGCLSIVVAGGAVANGHAERIADDKDHDLALLRLYGAQGLQPLGLQAGQPTSTAELVGIADPQNQGGGGGGGPAAGGGAGGRARGGGGGGGRGRGRRGGAAAGARGGGGARRAG
ncbi:peptidoglycan-binding protein, partial [Rhodopseudomonas sp. BAL398]|uniref:peptidoglycan-binding protein n=1 Tax=Rhodopseudomonas sp. BAL398 TaxID=3034676 RepID=UPI0023E241ED